MVFAEKILENPDRLLFKAIRKLGVIPGFVSTAILPHPYVLLEPFR
jgi:hypothetical protein